MDTEKSTVFSEQEITSIFDRKGNKIAETKEVKKNMTSKEQHDLYQTSKRLRQDEKEALEQRIKAMSQEEVEYMLKFVDPVLLITALHAYINEFKFLRKSMHDLFKKSQEMGGV